MILRLFSIFGTIKIASYPPTKSIRYQKKPNSKSPNISNKNESFPNINRRAKVDRIRALVAVKAKMHQTLYPLFFRKDEK